MTEPKALAGELVPFGPGGGTLTLPNGDPLTTAEWATIQADEQDADEHLESIKPKNTVAAYEADWQQWQRFRAWRSANGQPVHQFAGTPGTLVAFIRWLDDVEHRAPATIERRLAGVISKLRENGIEPGDAAARKTRAVINDIKKDRDKRARGRGRAAAATGDHITGMVNECDLDTLRGLRDRAMILIGFTIASRVSEAAGLNLPDVEVHDDGLMVHVPPVKLRNGTSARVVWVPASANPDSPTCPRAAWIAWTTAAELTSGPAWRSISRWGAIGEMALSTKTFERTIIGLARRAGLVVLTWHGLRAGLITQLIEAGEHPARVRQLSGHAEGSPEFERYVRLVLQKKNSPTKALNL